MGLMGLSFGATTVGNSPGYSPPYRGLVPVYRARGHWGMGLPKKDIMMADISRSCDLLEDMDSQKGNFDGLHKQVM
jgi:hypothetical protein